MEEISLDRRVRRGNHLSSASLFVVPRSCYIDGFGSPVGFLRFCFDFPDHFAVFGRLAIASVSVRESGLALVVGPGKARLGQFVT